MRVIVLCLLTPLLTVDMFRGIDLKPENVLISVPNVEEVLRHELASHPPDSRMRMMGVPASSGRGGNQTPRSISQPIGLDNLAFAMSKIETGDNSPPSHSGSGSGSGSTIHSRGPKKKPKENQEYPGHSMEFSGDETETITVKIADLGNGMSLYLSLLAG